MSASSMLRRTGRRLSHALAAFRVAVLPLGGQRWSRGILARSGLFDAAVYADLNGLAPFADTWAAIDHYLTFGAAADLRVHPGFDPLHYRHEAAGRGLKVGDPLLHYLLLGSRLRLSPAPDFDPAVYLRDNPDVAVARLEPLGHALRFGAAERRGADVALEPPPVPPLPAVHPVARPAPPAGDNGIVDVIVPVYRGREDAIRTLHSVLAARTAVAFELIVVNDASPEPDVAAALDGLAADGRITLLTHSDNLGFVRSVNRALALHPARDVVLLNADTAVFDHWLDRLVAPLSLPRVATVTPFSNAATIFSYPIRLRDNRARLEIPFAELDRLAATLPGGLVDVPTGVGFCMAIARAAIAEVGPFDADTFGKGYGEENDFCRRVAARGWRNVATTDTFVWHRGGGAFGAERAERVAAAQRELARLYPDYAGLVQRFIRRDPLAPARQALDIARIRHDPRPKAIRVGPPPAPAGIMPPAGDTAADPALWFDAVADLGRHHASLRLVPRAFGAVPNLPALTPAMPVAATADLLRRLEIGDVAIARGHGLEPRAVDRLAAAAIAAGCTLRRE